MALLSSRCCWVTNGCFFRSGVCSIWSLDTARLISQAKSYSIHGGKKQTFAVECMSAKNSKKRFIKPKKGVALETHKDESIELQANGSSSKGLLAALGIIIRQVSHAAFMEGLPINDCTTQVSYFAESSQAANQQVLTSLEPLDYLVVAFLPGISEELLFRGAMIPALGLNWVSVLVVASIFGALHLGSGRKYSFAIWATFVGVAYGYATVMTGSVVVPVVSHALNNLVGGLLWRYETKLSK